MKNIIRVGAIYLHNEGKVLMLLNKKSGLWFPPGGKAEPHEMLHEAAIRETFEETGVKVELRSYDMDGEKARMLPRPLWMQEESINGTRCEAAVYLVDVPNRNYTANPESTDSGWFTPGEIIAKENTLELIRQTMRELRVRLDMDARLAAARVAKQSCSTHGTNYRNWCFECTEKQGK